MHKGVTYRWTAGRVVLGAGLLLLLVAIALQFLRVPRGLESRAGKIGLAEMLPGAVPGWLAHDEPLGETETVKEKVAEVLNYDDYAYRRYSSSGREFAVYLAHWAAGRMPSRLIALHTPDRCWIENGWTCHSAEFNAAFPMTGVEFPPAQRRIFSPPRQSTPVFAVFWLITDGRFYDFGDRMNTVPSPFRWIGQVVQEIFTPAGEQLFVRITSDRPLEEFRGDPGFEQVMAALSRLMAPGGTVR